MKKIPTVYLRDPDNRSRVIAVVNPGCEWVLNGEGIPTRKYDGTCVYDENGRHVIDGDQAATVTTTIGIQ